MDNPVFQHFLFEIARGLLIFIGGSTSFIFFTAGIRILMSGTEWESNRNAVRLYNGGCSLTSMTYDERRRVKPGIAVHIKSNTWIAKGSVSDEAIMDAFS